MPTHEHFEELCSRAAAGDLSSKEHADLALHMIECGDCRTALHEYSTLASDYLGLETPARNNNVMSDVAFDRLRTRSLVAAHNQGLRLSDAAMLGPQSFWESASRQWRALAEGRTIPRLALACSFLLLMGVALFLNQRLVETNNALERARAQVEQQAARDRGESAKINSVLQHVSQERSTTGADLEKAQSELAEAQRHADELQATLRGTQSEIQRLQAELAAAHTANAAMAQTSNGQQAELASARLQIQQLRTRSSEIEAQFVDQQYAIKDLNAKLETQKLAAERERDLMAASSDVHNLMGARDLHMIDVHDADLKGNWKQPYGRIFITENRELTFFAFDLNAAGKDKVFQVWGQKLGDEARAVSLGVFQVDNAKQSRWLMKLDDAKLLANIDSVFVTVESSGGRRKPAGKTLMYAYLRNPINHP